MFYYSENHKRDKISTNEPQDMETLIIDDGK